MKSLRRNLSIPQGACGRLPKTSTSFEDYLKDIHAGLYHWNDDDMSDGFGDLNGDDYITYAGGMRKAPQDFYKF